MAMAGLKLCVWYRFGEQPAVLGRDRNIRIPVVDRCRHLNGTELETPRAGEHPQVLSHSPAPAAERFNVLVRKARAIPQAGHPGGPSGETSLRLPVASDIE